MQEKPCRPILYIHVCHKHAAQIHTNILKTGESLTTETTLTKKIEFIKKLGAQKIQLLLATNINSGYFVFYPKMLSLEYA
jgi:hypothetical protein